MEKTQYTTTILIQDLDTLKVIADPLRSQLLELLIQDTQTVKQLAEKLGLAPSKLYYHINLLEKHGLIEVVETRLVANMIEKLYHAVASTLEVDPELLRFSTPEGKESISAVLTSTIDATREDLVRSLEARAFELEQGAPEEPRTIMINRGLSRISRNQAKAFQSRLKELYDEFETADDEGQVKEGDAHPYALTIAFYPSFYFKDHEGELE